MADALLSNSLKEDEVFSFLADLILLNAYFIDSRHLDLSIVAEVNALRLDVNPLEQMFIPRAKWENFISAAEHELQAQELEAKGFELSDQ